MTISPRNPDPLHETLARLVEGALDEAARSELARQIADDPETQQRYIQFMATQAMLEREMRRNQSVKWVASHGLR